MEIAAEASAVVGLPVVTLAAKFHHTVVAVSHLAEEVAWEEKEDSGADHEGQGENAEAAGARPELALPLFKAFLLFLKFLQEKI